MTPTPHHTNTRTLGTPEGWNQAELPVVDLGITDTVQGGVPTIMSFWKPTAAELALLNGGGLVTLSIVGRSMPPVSLLAWCEPSSETPAKAQA